MIRRLRTTEAILKEKLDIDKESWENAMKKFSSYQDISENYVENV